MGAAMRGGDSAFFAFAAEGIGRLRVLLSVNSFVFLRFRSFSLRSFVAAHFSWGAAVFVTVGQSLASHSIGWPRFRYSYELQ